MLRIDIAEFVVHSVGRSVPTETYLACIHLRTRCSRSRKEMKEIRVKCLDIYIHISSSNRTKTYFRYTHTKLIAFNLNMDNFNRRISTIVLLFGLNTTKKKKNHFLTANRSNKNRNDQQRKKKSNI